MGKVLVADNPQQSLANLIVTVVATPTGKPTVSYRVLTDAQGQFSVDGIVTGKHLASGPLSVTNVVVSVDPAKTPYQAQKVSLLLTEGRATEVVLAMPPTSLRRQSGRRRQHRVAGHKWQRRGFRRDIPVCRAPA